MVFNIPGPETTRHTPGLKCTIATNKKGKFETKFRREGTFSNPTDFFLLPTEDQDAELSSPKMEKQENQ